MNLSEFNCRGPGEGLRGPWPALVNPSALFLPNRGSSGTVQHQHLFQVVTHSFQPKVIEVAPQAEIATSRQSIAALQGADDPLHRPAHPRIELIPLYIQLARGN